LTSFLFAKLSWLLGRETKLAVACVKRCLGGFLSVPGTCEWRLDSYRNQGAGSCLGVRWTKGYYARQSGRRDVLRLAKAFMSWAQ
jgi:hypothetical protein